MKVEDEISSAYRRAKKSVRTSLYAKMEESSSSSVYSARASLEGFVDAVARTIPLMTAYRFTGHVEDG